ncbi:MAG TPA: CsgG/HfaB family protein [Candidatus Cloacimonadota bacterium]|nr:CsgG/HfaB family protein [Candidatus Cloacimonadota bacterium]
MKIINVCVMLAGLGLFACAGFQSEVPTRYLNIEPLPQQTQKEEVYKLKRRIAVGRFSNETRAANSFLYAGTDMADRMSSAAYDILSTKLAMTQRFILLERQDTLMITSEQRIAGIEKMKIPADYLILGSISEFGTNLKGATGLIDRTKKQTAYAKVTLRIVDTRTGIIVFGEEGSGEAYLETGSVMGMGTQAGFDASLADKAIDAAISNVIQNLVNKLTSSPWHSYVLQANESQVYIAGGEKQGIKASDVFVVYKRGDVVDNPQTGYPIELPPTRIAKLIVIETIDGTELTELSLCKVIEGKIDPQDLKNIFVSENPGD